MQPKGCSIRLCYARVSLNEGMYRAGPAPAGLPLPRTGLGVLTAVVIAVSVLAALIPWLLLLGNGPADAWRAFREGGLGMWPIALFDFVLPVALGISGALAVRGKRVPPGLFFGIAVLPLFVALLFGWLAARLVEGALAGGAVDPSQAMRIHAAGMSEALSLDRFGGFVTCGAALIGAVALTGAVASIDVTTATRNDAARPSSVFGAATLVAGAAWVVGTMILTALRLRSVGPLSIWVVLVVATVVPLAVFAARAAPVLRGWHDPIEARRAASGLLVAGFAAMLAVLVFERAVLARTASDVFGAVSGESVDPSQRARILMELVEARKWTNIAYGFHAVLGGATFALALAGSIGSGRHPASPSMVIAASVGVFVLAATFALGVARTRSTDRIAAEFDRRAPTDVTLPVVVASMDEGKRAGSDVLTVKASGVTTGGPVVYPCSGGRSITLLADRRATLDMVLANVPNEPCSVELVFEARMEKDKANAARLGDLAPFVREDIATFGLSYTNRSATYPSSGYLTVRALEDETIEYEGNKVKLPLGPSSPDLRASQYETVRFVFRPRDTVGDMTRVVMAVKERFKGQLGWRATKLLEIDRPAPVVVAKPTVHLLTPVVSGRLPPEVVIRTTRVNQASLQRCYDTALEKDRDLTGKITVKLVIDRSGSVSSAQAQAEPAIKDRELGPCLARAWKRIEYPEPEGGIVVVSYPLMLGL